VSGCKCLANPLSPFYVSMRKLRKYFTFIFYYDAVFMLTVPKNGSLNWCSFPCTMGRAKRDSAEAGTGTGTGTGTGKARARQKRGDRTGVVSASSAETVQAVSSQPVQQGTTKTVAPTVGDTTGLGRMRLFRDQRF
jgi:hypothetical protein